MYVADLDNKSLSQLRLWRSAAAGENPAGLFEISRRIDAQGCSLDDRRIITVSGFKQAGLFQILRQLQLALRQPRVSIQSRPPIRIKPKVIEVRPPVRDRLAAEVQAAATLAGKAAEDNLDDVRIINLLSERDDEGADVDFRISKALQDVREQPWRSRRLVPLHVDDDVEAVLAIDLLQRREYAIAAPRQSWIGQHARASQPMNDSADFRIAGGHHHRANIRCDGALEDMLNHRLAVDVGERLVLEARRRHPRWNDNDRIHATRSLTNATAMPLRLMDAGQTMLALCSRCKYVRRD